MTGLPILGKAEAHRGRTAVIDQTGVYTHDRLLDFSAGVASALLGDRPDLGEARTAFLVSPGFAYPEVLYGVWRAGGIAVPLAVSHPPAEWEYYIRDAEASCLLAGPEFEDRLRPLADRLEIPLLTLSQVRSVPEKPLPDVAMDRRAMIVYTSGTTGRPKGAVTTHAQIQAQITTLIEAWGWTEQDHILHVLPLHHVHGIVNALLCALWAGAACEFLPRFDAETVWRRFSQGGPTLFMAVPTIYARLISAWENMAPDQRDAASAGAGRLRLMVSGSAALPVRVLEKWRTITGHVLLERYGMTEIGMALSNPLHGPRVPGAVGTPLPGVQAKLRDEGGGEPEPGQPGELLVKGPSVFLEYWRRPEATAEVFTAGWFKTGDVAVIENGVYRLLGRSSVDIIKTGGYKVSALEIEEVLREHPLVEECAVVGVPDEEWGQRVAAAAILKPERGLNLEELRAWAKERLAPYKVPTLWRPVEYLPRNALGKVQKHQIAPLFV
ncbi:MAG: acyl-CoA synthetase [Thermodesulfobacteriota bacterium]